MIKRILKLIISLLFWVVNCMHDGLLVFVGSEKKEALTILFYHEVPEHTKKRFEWQIKEIIKCFTVVKADYNARCLPEKNCIAITFDDAYQSVYYYALPMIREKLIPCHIFVPTGYIGKNPAWDIDNCTSVKSEVIMTEKQIKEVKNQLIMFGSHTHTHPRLSELKLNDISIELNESKRQIENLLDTNIDSLAFPHGSYDQGVVNEARNLGYTTSFSVIPDFQSYNRYGFVRGRVPVSTDDWKIEFFLKIRGSYRWMAIASRIISMLRKCS